MEMISLLNGMRDLPPIRWARLYSAIESLRRHFGLYGYQAVDVPILEETELFLRKSGGELAARMFTFTDPSGRRVSLRPELTASIVRAYIDGTIEGEVPIRVQYAGPVFRYVTQGADSLTQFNQVGAELLGVKGPAADAEIISLACSGLNQVGLTGYVLTVGHLGAINALLEQMELSERARLFFLANIALLKDGPQAKATVRQRAQELGLLQTIQQSDSLTEGMSRLSQREVSWLAERFLNGPVSGPTGQRTPKEIVDRYVRRLQGIDNPNHLGKALDFIERFARIYGSPSEALKEAHEVVADFNLNPAPLSMLEDTLARLQAYDLRQSTLKVDFGLARGIAYYTGVIFELTHPALPESLSLGGGGRYDDFVTALGGNNDVPALGFAYTIEHVLAVQDILGSPNSDEWESPPVMIYPNDSASLDTASQEAERLRRMGTPVELDLMGRTTQEAQAYATRKGLASVRVVRQDGATTDYPIKTQ